MPTKRATSRRRPAPAASTAEPVRGPNWPFPRPAPANWTHMRCTCCGQLRTRAEWKAFRLSPPDCKCGARSFAEVVLP